MYEKFKEKGIDHIICLSVNDPFVMNAWGKENNVDNKIIMLGDPFLNFTKDIGADVDKSGRGLGVKASRMFLYRFLQRLYHETHPAVLHCPHL